MIRLSFILPCYKVEKYLQACLDSIFKIDLLPEEYEVLCFNDCSPDGTLNILESNKVIHPNLHIYNAKENVGCGGGRNALLKIAKGQYVWIIDPDDLVASEKVVPFLLNAEKNNLDVLFFNYADITEDQEKMGTGSRFANTEVMDGLSFTDHVFGNQIVLHIGYVWRFLVRKDYLFENELFFPEKMTHQDTVWMPKLVLLSKRIQSVQEVGYLYRHHESSACVQFITSYPAKAIYTRCVKVTDLLLDFVNELEDMQGQDNRYHKYAQAFLDFAQSYYLNKLPLFLCRTSEQERRNFYEILKTNTIPRRILRLATLMTYILLNPVIGPSISSFASCVYKLTHKK